MIESTPNIDAADDGDMGAIMGAWLKTYIRENLDDMLPAKVISYDDATNRATVQPLIMVGTTDGQKISRAGVFGVPVFRFGGGGFFMRFPIKPGDFGWLKANDRDTSLMFQRGGLEDWPNTERLHSFSDAMFFPDSLKGWAISGANANALVLQSLDGTVCLSMHAGKVAIDAPLIEINGNVAITGDLVVTGDTGIGGALSNNGMNVGFSHVHGGVQTGSGNTGTPI